MLSRKRARELNRLRIFRKYVEKLSRKAVNGEFSLDPRLVYDALLQVSVAISAEPEEEAEQQAQLLQNWLQG